MNKREMKLLQFIRTEIIEQFIHTPIHPTYAFKLQQKFSEYNLIEVREQLNEWLSKGQLA